MGAEIRAEVASISVLIKARMQKEVEDVVEASEEAEVGVEAAVVETSSLPEQDTTSSCTPTSTA